MGRRVRRALEDIVLAIRLAALNRRDFFANADHGFNEPVQLRLRLTLRGLNHERASHREGERRRMESVIHEPLRDIFRLHS